MFDVKNTKDTEWKSAQKLMANPAGLMKAISDYDFAKIVKKKYNKLKSVYDNL
jgi:hypothetical protein